MAIDTESMGFIIKPLAVIDISVSMDESSFSICLVLFPPSLVHGTVWPNLSSFSLSDILSFNPLSVIFSVILKLDHCSVFNGLFTMVGLFIVVEFSELISDLLNLFVIIVLLAFFIV